MNALDDKANKQGMPYSDMHSITWPHYSTIIPISSMHNNYCGVQSNWLVTHFMKLDGSAA